MPKGPGIFRPQGRLTKETFYEDGKTSAESTITYKYDNSGGLAKITDTAPLILPIGTITILPTG